LLKQFTIFLRRTYIMKLQAYLSAYILCHFFFLGNAQQNRQELIRLQEPVRFYQVGYTEAAIEIDGRDLEDAWEQAAWSDAFIDIEGKDRPQPAYATRVKMLWDKEHLYIFAHLEEPHIWATLKQRDTIIYHNNDFEVFIKPDRQGDAYFEIEVNPFNTILDLLMVKPYRFGGKAKLQWDVKNLQSAVHIQGSLNQPEDKDAYWTVEMAIPFSSLNFFGEKASPQLNDQWRLNFSRVQWPHDIIEGQYQRKKGSHEDNWVWSPIGLVNMHYPERWGYLQFVESPEPETYQYPESHALEKDLWNLHYIQGIYFKKNQQYLPKITAQHTDAVLLKHIDEIYHIDYTKTKNFYRIELTSKKNPKLKGSIDAKGNMD